MSIIVSAFGINKTEGTSPDPSFHHESMMKSVMEACGGLLLHPPDHTAPLTIFYEDLRTEPAGVKMSAPPSRVSLFTLTFNPALVGGAFVHRFKDSIQCG